jgi:small-conductance mechanosensitive channel
MYNWFECKLRYDKMLDTGIQKTVTEPYLVDALSFTEAEARIIEEIKPYISGEFTISDIKRVKYSDTFFNETGDRYFRAKLYFLTLDEKSGSEKKTAVNMLVQATLLKEAVEIIETEMKKTMIDYTIAAVTETALMDVFPYSGDKASKQQE